MKRTPSITQRRKGAKAPGGAAVAIVIALWASPAQAQSEADLRFELGVAAFDRGDHAAALEAFEASYAADPVPEVLFNIAMCRQAVGDLPGAVNAFRRYLAVRGDAVAADERALIDRQLAAMLPRVGLLVVRASEPDAVVTVDGRPMADLGPGVPFAVTPGEHTVEARKDGFLPSSAPVGVDAGGMVSATLTLSRAPEPLPPTGRLVVLSNVAGARVLVEGVEVGTTPYGGDGPPGLLRFAVLADGYEPYEDSVRVMAGEVLERQVTLVAVAPPPPAPRPPTAEPRPSTPDPGPQPLGWWFWGSLTAAGAAGAAAAITGGLTWHYRSEYLDGGLADTDAYDTGIALRTATDVLLGVTVAATLTALIALFSAGGEDEPAPGDASVPSAASFVPAAGAFAVAW